MHLYWSSQTAIIKIFYVLSKVGFSQKRVINSLCDTKVNGCKLRIVPSQIDVDTIDGKILKWCSLVVIDWQRFHWLTAEYF